MGIDKDYAKILINKVKVFKQQTKTKKQLFLVMITAHGIKTTLYSEEIVDDSASLEDLF